MRVFRKFRQLLDVDWDNIGDGDALVRDGDTITGGTAGGGGGAPTDATYITQTANGDLENEQALSALSTGLVKVTNGTGVLSTATGGTDYANASHQHAGEDITSGTVADARIASTIARDSEVAAAISAHESDTTNVHGITDTSALETTSGAQAKVDAHVNDTSAAHAASAISIADAGNDFTATDVEGALAELQSDHETDAQNLADHIADTSDAHDASAISVADSGGFYTATDVEGVLAEIAPQLGAGSSESHAMLADYKSSGTAGGGFTQGAWQTRVLNTEVYDPDGIVSLSSNQFTLGAGTYRILWRAPAAGVNGHATRLQNVTDASTVAPGSSQVAAAGGFVCNESTGSIRFTIAASKAFEIQHQCQTTKSTDGFGAAAAFTVSNEVYTQVWIVKE